MRKMGNLKKDYFTTQKGEKIAYHYNENNGPKILLIHGNASSSTEWTELIEKLEDSYQLLVPDLRGFGDSSYNEPVSELLPLAEDLVELVNALEWDKMIVIAWSLGGGVGAEFCHLIPDRVEKLVLTASMWMAGYPMYEFKEDGTLNLEKPLKTREELSKSPYYLPAYVAVKEKKEDILKETVQGLFALKKAPEDFVDGMLESEYKQQNLLDVDYALLKFNITDQPNASGFPGTGHYHDLTMPILILHGTADVMVDDELAKKNKDLFGDQAELKLFEGANHVLHLDAEEDWDQAVKAFLKK